MRMCAAHWEDLRIGLKDEGLLLANTLIMQWLIESIDQLNPAAYLNSLGEICPVCFFDREEWIGRAIEETEKAKAEAAKGEDDE